VHSLEGGRGALLEAVSLRVCSQTSREHMSMGTSPYINQPPLLISRNISMGTWEHIRLGNSLGHNAIGFFCGGRRSLKIHIEIKKGVVSVLSPTHHNQVERGYYHPHVIKTLCHGLKIKVITSPTSNWKIQLELDYGYLFIIIIHTYHHICVVVE
jgi:hypothetical protein